MDRTAPGIAMHAFFVYSTAGGYGIIIAFRAF